MTPYAGHPTDLFDDAIEPAAVAFGPVDPSMAQPRSAKDEALLRERTQASDAVVRARVVTLTSSNAGEDSGWQLGFHTTEGVAGKTPPEDFSFFVAARGPAAGIVRMLDAHLIGATFVVFLRHFEPVPGDDPASAGPDLHVHIAKDDKDELGAVRQASLLGEVR